MNQMSHPTNGNGVVDELALFTRIVTGLAALTGLLYLRVILGGSLVATYGEKVSVWLPLTIGLLALGILGALLSWRWQGISAGVMLVAGLGLSVAFYWLQRAWGTAVFYGSPFVIAGTLCLVCRFRRR